MLKYQKFKNGGYDKIKPRGSNYQQLYVHDNEKRESLYQFEDEGKRKNIRYDLLSSVTPPQKELHCPTNIGKKIKSLKHLVCIPKMGSSYNCLFYIKIHSQKVLKSQKNYIGRL